MLMTEDGSDHSKDAIAPGGRRWRCRGAPACVCGACNCTVGRWTRFSGGRRRDVGPREYMIGRLTWPGEVRAWTNGSCSSSGGGVTCAGGGGKRAGAICPRPGGECNRIGGRPDTKFHRPKSAGGGRDCRSRRARTSSFEDTVLSFSCHLAGVMIACNADWVDPISHMQAS